MKLLDNLVDKFKRNKKRRRTYSQLSGELDYKNKKTDARWRVTFLVLRVIWALVPLVLLAATSWFTFWLVDGIGRDKLDFSGHEGFINVIAVDILVHVVALTGIVMRFLFPRKNNKDKKESQKDNELFDLPSSH